MNPELIRIYYEEDAGGGGGTTETKPVPKFSSQLSPDRRETHKAVLEEMGESYSLNDAFDELITLKANSKRSILMPEKDNPEDMKRFMKDMGIPETIDGYELEAKAVGADLQKSFKEQAMKSGLTKTQAKAVMGFIDNLVQTGSSLVADTQKKLADTYEQRLTEATGSKDKATEVHALATKFLIRLGNEDVIKQMGASGMIFNTAFMQKAAEFEKALGDAKFVDGSGPGTSGTKEVKGAMGNYDPAFAARYGVPK